MGAGGSVSGGAAAGQRQQAQPSPLAGATKTGGCWHVVEAASAGGANHLVEIQGGGGSGVVYVDGVPRDEAPEFTPGGSRLAFEVGGGGGGDGTAVAAACSCVLSYGEEGGYSLDAGGTRLAALSEQVIVALRAAGAHRKSADTARCEFAAAALRHMFGHRKGDGRGERATVAKWQLLTCWGEVSASSSHASSQFFLSLF